MEPRPDSESALTRYRPPQPDRDRIGLHIGLFLATFACMVFVGTGLSINGQEVMLSLFARYAHYEVTGWPGRVTDALLYAVPFLLFLTVHEFGHYFAARRHRVRVSLPYYIPLPLAFGTFGAVIRIRERIRTTTQLFDIGAAGPLSGFVVALGVLAIGIAMLPPVEYLLSVETVFHGQLIEDFRETGAFPSRGDMIETIRGSGLSMVFGDTALFSLLMSLGEYPVPGYEISHYPLLLAGWLGLFFTALNLLPVGQLDGGHVVYALFGPAVHRVVARVTTLLLILSGSLGWIVESVPLLEASYGPNGEALALAGWAALLAVYLLRFFEGEWKAVLVGLPVMAGLVGAVVLFVPGLAASVGYSGWLLWSGLILFLIRMDHPPVLVHEPLTPGRVALGWVCIVIFALCFSIQPILVV